MLKNGLHELEIFFNKTIHILGREFTYEHITAICIFLCLSTFNFFNFIFVLVEGNFYSALFNAILFAWNSGLVYWNFLLNKTYLLKKKTKKI